MIFLFGTFGLQGTREGAARPSTTHIYIVYVHLAGATRRRLVVGAFQPVRQLGFQETALHENIALIGRIVGSTL